MAKAEFSASILRTQFFYEPTTGIFTRLGENLPSGRIATKGYRQICVNARRYMAHRLAWLYVYGEWPDGQIDHINQSKDDNRLENLRIVSNKQNAENITHFSHNTTGRRGVIWVKRLNCWRAEIKHNKQAIYLGNFGNIIDAVAARMKAERELFTHTPDYSQIYARDQQSLINSQLRGGPRAPERHD